jgi:head-tail adaptor
MNRGDLRDRITFEYRAPVVDSSGTPIQDPNTGEISYTWTFKAKAWANVQFLSARELIAA